MPKSRGRHHRKANRSTRRVRPQRDAATIDAFADFRLLAATDAAEARGDVEGALEIMEHGPQGIGSAPAVAAALLDPAVFSALWDTLRAVDAENVRRLAATLAGPAADLCRLLAVDLQATA